MKKKFLGWILFLITICNGQYVGAQELLTNVYGRQYTFLYLHAQLRRARITVRNPGKRGTAAQPLIASP